MSAKRNRQVNPIDVVECAYDLEGDDRAWLRQLAEAIRPLLEGGHGMAAYTFDARTSPAEWLADALLFDMDAAKMTLVVKSVTSLPELVPYVYFNNTGLLSMHQLGQRAGLGDLRQRPQVRELYELLGVVDYAAVQTVEPGGAGIVFAAGQSKERVFDQRSVRLWARVNAHIAAGRRLRAAAAASAPADDAVLTASGKLEHAEGDARTAAGGEALRAAVLRQEKARGRARREEPEAATEAWTALVAGRWSLVDRFERGGRRYIVARRNAHVLPDPRALTPRERAIAHLTALGRSNKLTAYELGLAESTVASHLSAIMRKLGVASRVELIRMVSQFGMAPTTPT